MAEREEAHDGTSDSGEGGSAYAATTLHSTTLVMIQGHGWSAVLLAPCTFTLAITVAKEDDAGSRETIYPLAEARGVPCCR